MKSYLDYASYYDVFYEDKDYDSECKFIKEIFKKYSKNPVKNILEGGCGTGGHAIPLSREYNVTGFDLSDDMIKIAKKKNSTVNFSVADMRNFDFNKKYDACLFMFACLGYITTNEEIQITLNNVRKSLDKDGLFIFDVWNGLAVVNISPEQRMKEIEKNKIKFIRFATPKLNPSEHTCEVKYKILIFDKINNQYREINEKHLVRFFFPQEIKFYLENAGFKVMKICPFMNLDGKIDENSWNMSVISRAK